MCCMKNATLPVLAATALLLVSAPSHAYLDPGTGSIILQGLLASIAVAIGVARGYWHRFRAFFSRTESQTTPSESDGEAASAKESEAPSQP